MIRAVLAALVVALSAPAIAQTSLAPPPPPKASKATKTAPDPLLADASATVARTLKDPGSAQFQNVRQRIGQNKQGQPIKVVCGDVNAKNSYGGYTGFAPWIYLENLKMAFVLGPDQNIATIAMLKDYCS